MRYRIILPVVAKALLLVCIVSSTVFSQIKITSPIFQSVYQRDFIGQREITVSGTFTALMDKIEVRAVPAADGQGVPTPWQDLQVAPKGGVFSGKIKLLGGWYTLEVRGIADGKVVGRDVLARFGIGEVFLIAGQSNAQGLKNRKTAPPGAEDDRVIYIDNYENDPAGKYNDRLTDPVPPTFSKITSDIKTMSPRGQTAWCWGALGDMLVNKLNVPVLFINAAWEGTSVTNWAESASGKKTVSFYGYNYNTGMPYANLRISAKNYGNQYGMRAVLWMQGETDGFFGTTSAVYRTSLQKIIDQLSIDTQKRVYWVIARTSLSSGDDKVDPKPYPGIIAAQNAVLNTPFNPTYPGPETDPLVPDRKDGLHFEGPDELRILANAWNQTLDANFFSTVTPLAPTEVPALTASCVTQNNAVTLSLPAGYSSYEWRSDKEDGKIIGIGSSITVSQAATYSATVRDAAGNSILTPIVVLDHDAKPAQPSILQSGEQQACADSSFRFSVNDEGYIYNWFKESATTPVTSGAIASIAESGNYYVKAQNIFGCVSDNSATSKLTIRAKISKPTIEPSGPFSVTASIPEGGEVNENFVWRRPDTETDTTATLVKILKSGVYTTKAKVTYTIGSNNLVCYSDTASREFKTNEQNEVVIYPNPSQGTYIYIESRDNIKDAAIELFDIRGNLIKSTAPKLLDSRMQIDVGILPTGKYILRVTGQGQTLTKQIVIR